MIQKHRRSRRGLTLVESALALALAGLVAIAVIWLAMDASERSRAASAAEHLRQITSAAESYLKANHRLISETVRNSGSSEQALVIVPARIDRADPFPSGPEGSGLPSLQGGGFISADFVDVNAYGQSHAVIVRKVPGQERLEAIVTSMGGRPIEDSSLGLISHEIGATGGFVPTRSLPGLEGVVTGTGGGWATRVDRWTIQGTGPSAGHAVSALAIEDSVVVDDFLYRDTVPGFPEANRMETDLSLGEGEDIHSITDIRSLESGSRAIVLDDPRPGFETFLTLRNVESRIVLSPDGSVSMSNDVDVSRDVVSGQDVVAGGSIMAGEDVTAGSDVEGGRFVDIDDPSMVLDPSDRSEINRVVSRYFDLDTEISSMTVPANRFGTRSGETMGQGASRLWGCFVEYRFANRWISQSGGLFARHGIGNPGDNWVRGPRLDGSSNTGNMSSWATGSATRICRDNGCGLQVRVNCDAPPPPPQPTPDEGNTCPAWMGMTGTWPNCTYDPTCRTPWGTTIQTGESVTAWREAQVPFGQSCQPQTRTCNRGTLSGTYQHRSCSVAPPANCVTPWGTSVAHGSSVVAWRRPSVAYGSSCESQRRTCNNGFLSGTFENQSCNPPACHPSQGQACTGTMTWWDPQDACRHPMHCTLFPFPYFNGRVTGCRPFGNRVEVNCTVNYHSTRACDGSCITR